VSNPYLEKAEQQIKQGVSPVTTGVLIVFHLASLGALFTFSWRNLIVALILHWMAVGLGISMGYHRLHTHRGFKTYKWFDYFLAICGTLTLEGGPIFWVATHRLHHQYSDKPEDPHSPRVSGFWAHVGWIIFGEAQHDDTARLARYAPDLSKDPFYRWLSGYHWVPLTAVGLALLAWGGWGMVLWAIFLRVTVGLHATWMINSATTTITRTRCRRVTAWRGTSSTGPGCRSSSSVPWASCGTSRSPSSVPNWRKPQPSRMLTP